MSTPEHKALANLIVSLTTTGEWILNNQKLKELKSLCKKSDSIVENAYRLTWAQLEKNHAQIRYSSLQLVEQLFSRSHHFRQLLAADYPSFLQLTVGIHRKTLPPPENVAAKLAEYGTTLVKQWYEKFGDTYKPLTLGYQYLKNNMRVNFADLSLASYTTRAREQEQREAALKISRQRKFEKIRADFDGQINDIQENLRNMETCFEILVPKPDENINLDFDSLLRGVSGADPAAVGATSGSLKNTIATHGLGSSRYRLTIHLSAENPMDVSETADNEAVYENLREYYGVLTKKHVDVVAGWLDGLMKSESEHSEARDSMLKKVIDLKNALRVAKNKSELVGLKSNRNDDNDDDEGIEFEEVPIPANAGEGPSRSSKQHGSAAAGGDREKRLGSTTTSSKQLPPAHRVFPLAFEPEMEEDVTYARPKLYVSHAEREDGEVEISVGESTRTLQALADRKGKTKEPVRKIVSSREELLEKAPIVEWGDDLYYWDKDEVQFNTGGLVYSHRAYGEGGGEKTLSKDTLSRLKMRTVYYKPVIPEKLPACRAPLKNGTLCPRRDLVTCPFHGKIVPRDETGRLVKSEADISENDGDDVAAPPTTPETFLEVDPPDLAGPAAWEELEDDVMNQIGVKKVEVKKRKRADPIPSALVDLRKKPETSRTRLQKRMADPKVKKAIEEELRHQQSMRYRDKKTMSWR